MAQAKECCGENEVEIRTQIAEFPNKLEEVAEYVPVRDHGPFPLFHPDFGHNNMIVDDDYNILGVVDWEYAYSAPWERVYFPIIMLVVLAPMSPPEFYDENGIATEAETRAEICEQAKYVNTVQKVEQSKGLSSFLSATLANREVQDLAYVMKLYTEDGKFGWYTNVLDPYHKKRKGVGKDFHVSGGVARESDGEGS